MSLSLVGYKVEAEAAQKLIPVYINPSFDSQQFKG